MPAEVTPLAPVCIALLRGVNVGGAGRLPMVDFRALLADLGASDVQTYIQSGNAVFRAAQPSDVLAGAIAAEIARRFGFRPAVFVRDLPSLEAILAACPFAPAPEAEATVHLFLLDRPAPQTDLAALAALAAPDERFVLTDAALYLSAPSGIGRSALVRGLDRLIDARLTARNLRSLRAILALARALEDA